MNWVWTGLTALLVITSLVLHEVGHAVALRQVGGRVAEMGVFFGKPRWTIRWARLPFPVSIGWIPAGAYIKPHPDDEGMLRDLPYRAQAWYLGAGPVANLLFGLGLWAVVGYNTGQVLTAIIASALYLLIWQFRRGFTAYMMPVLGVLLAGYLVWAILGHPIGTVVGGPITVARDTVSTGLWEALNVAGGLSVSFGLFNMLPLWPLDGGWTAAALVRQWFHERGVFAYNFCTAILAIGLVAYAFTGDIVGLIQ